MKRWLPVLAVAAVAVGVIVRLSAGSSERREASPKPEAAESGPSLGSFSAPASGPVVQALEQRLLEDDRLTPPSPGASVEELAAYERALEAIRSGQDPLKTQQPSAKPSPPVPPEEIRRRIETRRKAAEERRKKALEEVEKIRAEARKARQGNPHYDPNRPPPPPLVPPPVLGPAVVESPK